MNQEPVFYLAHRYTHHPDGEEGSYQEVVKWKTSLSVDLGLKTYSPIISTHEMWQYIKRTRKESEYPSHRWWLDNDFDMIKSMMNNDGKEEWEYKLSFCECGESIDWQYHSNDIFHCKCGKINYRKIIIYDSGIVILMDENAYEWLEYVTVQYIGNGLGRATEGNPKWHSEGCKMEVEFARRPDNPIRVWCLQKLMKILPYFPKPVKIEKIMTYIDQNKIDLGL